MRDVIMPPFVSQRTTPSAPARAAVFRHCSAYSLSDAKPSKKCSASKKTVRPLLLRKRTESAIIARFSSSVVSRTSRDLPVVRLADDRDDRRLRVDAAPAGSASFARRPPARRVEPKAASRAFRSLSSPARAKNSASFGFEPGQPPSM